MNATEIAAALSTLWCGSRARRCLPHATFPMRTQAGLQILDHRRHKRRQGALALRAPGDPPTRPDTDRATVIRWPNGPMRLRPTEHGDLLDPRIRPRLWSAPMAAIHRCGTQQVCCRGGAASRVLSLPAPLVLPIDGDHAGGYLPAAARRLWRRCRPGTRWHPMRRRSTCMLVPRRLPSALLRGRRFGDTGPETATGG